MDDPVQGDHLRSIIERIERLEAEKQTIADDIKEVLAEARGNGYNVKVIKKVVALRKQDANERAEFEAVLDLYMQAVGEYADTPLGRAAAPGFSSRAAMARSTSTYPERVSRPAVAPAKEQDPSGGDAGSSVRAAAPEFPEPDATPAGAVVAIRSGVTAGETAADARDVEATVEQRASASFLAKLYDLRPLCLNRDNCGSYGSKHCGACERAAREAPADDADLDLPASLIVKTSPLSLGEQA